MKKKELLEQIDALDCRLDYAEETIARLLDKNADLEENDTRLAKKLLTIAEYFHGTCHPHINQIDKIIND